MTVSAWGSVTCGVVLALLSAAPEADAKARKDPITQKIEKQRRTLEKLKDEIEETKKQSNEAERKRESLVQATQNLDERLIKSRHEHQQVNGKLKLKDRELEEINRRIGMLKSSLAERRSSVRDRLRVLYMQGRHGYVRSLLAAESYAEFLRRLHDLSAVSRREYDLIQGFRQDLKHLAEVENRRLSARQEMLSYKQTMERRLKEIEGIRREKRELLARVTLEKESYDRTVAELERSASRVDTLLKDLEDRRRAAAAASSRKSTGGAHPLKGLLPWPADGQVVSYFGRQKHATFDTYIQKKGIEIRTPEGSPIRAVMEGTVAYADWLKGYGLVLILDHLNGFFSLYAHASKLLADVGDRVPTGHVIGETGDTGMTGENTLYFELREGAEAVDPLTWLAKR